MLDNSTHWLISQALSYEYVTENSRAWELLRSLDREEVYALDFETTSLAPERGIVRLSTIAGHGKQFILDHSKCGPFSAFAEWFSTREWAVYNACFEGAWIDWYSDNMDVILYDIQFMRKAKLGGAPLSLKIMCKRDLKLELVKEQQVSDWAAKELSSDQLDYAMLDSVATFALWEHWCQELTPEQWHGALNINEAWRGTVEMQDTGLQLDVHYHTRMLNWWKLKRDTAERYLRKWTPPKVLGNLRSNKQISNFLCSQVLDAHTVSAWPKTGKRGELNLERNTLRQAAHRLPYPQRRWLAALIIFRKQEKYISTYGQKLIDAQLKQGKITSRFNMAQAVTGRYSSSNFNLQNIPHNPVVRRSFVAIRSELGKTIELVMGDYKSIEVRVLAELSGDKQLLYDAIYGDVHSRSAAQIYGIPFEYFTEVINSDAAKHTNAKASFKAMRSRAKAFTFQLLYGAGASALAVVLRCTDDEASAAITSWAKLYPKAYHYRQLMFEKMMFDGFLPVIDGRTIYVNRLDRSMPVAANYPVQGAAASVMYRAVYHTHKLLATSDLEARLAASVHDELLMFATADDAPTCGTMLVDGMVRGWLDIFPHTNIDNLVGDGNHATIGWHWGMKQ